MLGDPSDELHRHLEAFQPFLQPVGDLRVAVAVADEGKVVLGTAGEGSRGGTVLFGTSPLRPSGEKVHRRPRESVNAFTIIDY